MLLQIGGGAGQLPQWATSLIIFGSCVLVTTLVLVAGRLVHHFADRHAGDSLLLLLLLLSVLSHVVLFTMQAPEPDVTVNTAVVGLHVVGQPVVVNETLNQRFICSIANKHCRLD